MEVFVEIMIIIGILLTNVGYMVIQLYFISGTLYMPKCIQASFKFYLFIPCRDAIRSENNCLSHCLIILPCYSGSVISGCGH